MSNTIVVSITVALAVFAGVSRSYPLDAYEETRIRRIEAVAFSRIESLSAPSDATGETEQETGGQTEKGKKYVREK